MTTLRPAARQTSTMTTTPATAPATAPMTTTTAAPATNPIAALLDDRDRQAVEGRRDTLRNLDGQFDRPATMHPAERARRDRVLGDATPLHKMTPTRAAAFEGVLTAELVDAFKREPVAAVFTRFITRDDDLLAAHNALKAHETSRPDTPAELGESWFQAGFDKCVRRLETARTGWRAGVVPDELNMALNSTFGLDAFAAYVDDRDMGRHEPLARALIDHVDARIAWLEAKTARAAVDAPSIRVPYGQQLHGIDAADLGRFVSTLDVATEFGWLRELASTHEPEAVALGQRFMAAVTAARDVLARA